MAKDKIGEDLPPITVEDEINRAWEASGANQPASDEAREELTEFYYMETAELETIVGLGQAGEPDYDAAQKVLLARPREFKAGQSGGKRYLGNNM